MAIVTAEIRFAPQLAAWFTANPTLVLADGELAYCSDGANAGKYKLGDGTTQLSALTFYGGVSASGLTIGTTTITSGTTTRILYNNAGVVGEYLVTGTGTTAVLSTSPTFTTGIQINTGTNSGRAFELFQDTASVKIGSLAGATSEGGIYINAATPSAFNYVLRASTSTTIINGQSSLVFASGATNCGSINSSGSWTFNSFVNTSGAITPFTITVPANTNQALSTNIPNFKVTGSTKQKATGADGLQYYNWFTSNTSSYVGASTLTLGANSVFEYMQGGTNATITTSAAIYVPTLALTNTTTGIGLLIEGPTGATNKYAAKFIQGTGTTYIGEWASGRGGIWFNNTPSASNFHVGANATGTDGYLNGSTASRLLANGNIIVSAFPTQVTFLPSAATGSTVNFDFTSPNNTSRTASTNVSNFIVRGGITTFNTGALATQYFNYFSSNTLAFGTASTASKVYGAYFETSVAGTFATITTNIGIGTDGHLEVGGGIIYGTTTANFIQLDNGIGAKFAYNSSNLITVGNTNLTATLGGSQLLSFQNVGGQINYNFTPANLTALTASTELVTFKVTGHNKQFNTGALATQRFNHFTANTVSFVGASTATNVYGAFFEASVAGTNATITNNYSLGTDGKAKFGGNIELTQTVTTELVVSDTTVTIVINGTTYKLLAKA